MSDAGRPTLYSPTYCEYAERLAKIGCTNLQIAQFFGVDLKTIANWCGRHPEFFLALKVGRAGTHADENVKRSLYSRAVGYDFPEEKVVTYKGAITERYTVIKHLPPDVQAATVWLMNRVPTEFRPARELDRERSDEQTIAVMKIIAQKMKV